MFHPNFYYYFFRCIEYMKHEYFRIIIFYTNVESLSRNIFIPCKFTVKTNIFNVLIYIFVKLWDWSSLHRILAHLSNL